MPTRADVSRLEPHGGYLSRLLTPTLADLIRVPLAGPERGRLLAGGALVALLVMVGVR